ncbi:MAG: hypothetical protein RJA07_2431 [Bacteroidota bacterium]|jgi:uncharacterized protein with HEPN domain
MHKNALIYVQHILTCIESIEEYTNGLSEQDFLNTKMVQDAVIRNFEVIGEASKHVNEELKEKYNKVEWRKMGDLRNKLIHDYIGVDIWAVYRVVTNIIPELKMQILEIIEKETKN